MKIGTVPTFLFFPMILKIDPVPSLSGSIFLPASKSYSIRAVFVAACGGHSRLFGLSDCDDAKAAMRIIRSCGVRIKEGPRGDIRVDAPGQPSRKKTGRVDVRESGTSLRFLLPLLPFYFHGATVTGRGTLVGRPNRHLCEALRRAGLDIRGRGAVESVPVVYRRGELSGGSLMIDGSLSSQFISALLIASPRLEKETRLLLKGRKLVSSDYVVMTERVLERAGIRIVRRSAREFRIPGGQVFRGLKDFHVPSDLGLAAFFMVASALVRSSVTLRGCFDAALPQADGAIVGLLKKMGHPCAASGGKMRLKGPVRLKGGTFSLAACPDLVPIMTVVAMFAQGPTVLKDIAHARAKESDRISDLRRELLKVGADIKETPDR
ncbi:MAG: hypothetical protein GX606_03390, partial [Elusimicrobia bacterium]|nr:hypothetical protein [Elusimicrobiota bacterium]